jgi:hypothetical protein
VVKIIIKGMYTRGISLYDVNNSSIIYIKIGCMRYIPKDASDILEITMFSLILLVLFFTNININPEIINTNGPVLLNIK